MKHFLREIVDRGVLSEQESRELRQDSRSSGKQKLREALINVFFSSGREQEFVAFIRSYASHVHTISVEAVATLDLQEYKRYFREKSSESHPARSEPLQLSQDSVSNSDSGSTSPELDKMMVYTHNMISFH